MGRSRGTLVGLDIGTTGVRAVELRTDGRTGQTTVHRAAAVPLPHGAMRGGRVIDAKVVARALRQLWKAGRFSSRHVAFAITDANLLTRQLELPWMAPADFASALRYQVQESLPIDMAAAQLDYHLLDEITRLDAKGHLVDENRILVVATERSQALELAGVVRSAGLVPVVADIAPFAHIRAACGGVLPTDQEPRAIVDIGAEQVTVTVHAGGQPRFIRTLNPLGGLQATSAIADALDLDREAAELLKRETGLNGPAPALVPVAESSVFQAVAGTVTIGLAPSTATALGELNMWATGIVAEIRNSLDYYMSASSDARITTITVVGGAIALTGLRERMATELGYPVTVSPAFLGLEAHSRAQRAVEAPLAMAIGLAMARRP
ncbi:MAG: type IV pilus assembly protein PilM [Candidatus Nanopelagicales bacterium]|nr:type IV pilus assembly protein PilM [Candidatus Nanopelagicales bacterium]